MKPLISIISINYNSLSVTCEMLDSVQENSYPNIEVIVVDNASQENPVPFLNQHYPAVQAIRSNENLGFAGGNNLGIAASKGDYLFFLNNDAVLTNGALENLIQLFEAKPKAGAISPLICYFEKVGKFDLIQYAGTTTLSPLTGRNSTIGEREIDKGQYHIAQKTAYAHGCAMMIPRSVITLVGTWPEDFFLYYEELDYCEQIRNAGYEIFVQPQSKIYHKESYSIGASSPLKTYYINRNRVLFMRRNMNFRQLLVFYLFFMTFAVPKYLVGALIKGDWQNIKAYCRAIFWNLKHSIPSNKVKEKTSFVAVSH